MITMNCIIVDDQKESQLVIEDLINLSEELTLVGSYSTGEEAYQILDKRNDIDILLLDIEMPEMTGFQLLEKLKRKPTVILVTNHDHYAAISYEYEVVDFLKKPVSLERFRKAIVRARKMASRKKPEDTFHHIFVFSSNQIFKIDLNDIILISPDEDNRNDKWINTSTGQYKIRNSLDRLENELNAYRHVFFRTHKSFLINLEMVERIDRFEAKIHLKSGYLADIGKDRLKELMHLIRSRSV